MTKAQLVGYFRDYRAVFPEWSVKHDVVLCRSTGPVEQQIGFQALRSGGYRPSHSVDVAGGPDGGQVLFQFLDVRHCQILPREHAAKWPLVVRAMEDQFLPALREPLEPTEVLRLGEESVERGEADSSVVFSSLAALSAHLGELDKSLKWCDRSDSRLASMGRELADWELRLASFNQQLRQAVQVGRTGEFLRGGTDCRPSSS
jgi:hypothetical protein